MGRLILRELVPRVFNTDAGDPSGDTRRFLDVLQGSLDDLLGIIDEFSTSFDPDRAPAKCIDLMLLSAGNPFSYAYSLPIAQRRKIVKILVPLYLEKGTEHGIENAARVITGIDVRVVFPPTVYEWILDVSVLGDGSPPSNPSLTEEAVLGQSYEYTARSFQLEVDTVLTDDEREILRDIAEIMKPLNTHFVGFSEPTTGADIQHWELSISELETQSDLH